jgi:hypothetical protein
MWNYTSAGAEYSGMRVALAEPDAVTLDSTQHKGLFFIMPAVAKRLVETLSAAAVERIFGLVGDSLNGIIDSLRGHKEIVWMPSPEIDTTCR